MGEKDPLITHCNSARPPQAQAVFPWERSQGGGPHALVPVPRGWVRGALVMQSLCKALHLRDQLVGQSPSHVQAGTLRLREVKTLAQRPSGRWSWAGTGNQPDRGGSSESSRTGSPEAGGKWQQIHLSCLTCWSQLQAQRPSRVLETSGSPADKPGLGRWHIRATSQAGWRTIQKSPFLLLFLECRSDVVYAAYEKNHSHWTSNLHGIMAQPPGPRGPGSRVPTSSPPRSATGTNAPPRVRTALGSNHMAFSGTDGHCHMLGAWHLQAGKGWVSKKHRKANCLPSHSNRWTSFSYRNDNKDTWTASWLLPIFSSQEYKSHASSFTNV